MDISVPGFSLTGLGLRNVLLGKNGCGKSHLLKAIETGFRGQPTAGAVRYISPERGGALTYAPHIEQNIVTSQSWLDESRRQNRADQFRQQSAAQFRRLELLVLREIESQKALRDDPSQTFDTVVTKINSLLDRVLIERADPTFVIKDRKSGATVSPDSISSGEAELISLGIESLVFARECQKDRVNLLLLDEPDVHLHPDLQARLGRFLASLTASGGLHILIATHSTAFLSALGDISETRIAFMKQGDQALSFQSISETYKRILPVFGAHPLSNIFNEAPILLVEGEDDERVWQQAVRSAQGQLAIYPVAVDSIQELHAYEEEVAKILEAVYDDAVGFSLRDRDEKEGALAAVGPVRRYRLACRAAENLLLSEDVLQHLATSWDVAKERIAAWCDRNQEHPHFSAMSAFVAEKLDRQNHDLKEIRNDLVGLLGSAKPWEVLVGQAIARLVSGTGAEGAHSLRAYLGPELVNAVLGVGANAA